MSPSAKSERRHYPRHRVKCELRGLELPLLGNRNNGRESLHAEVENISAGGLCLVCKESMEVESAVRCEIFSRELKVPIPVLTQVRWARQIPETDRYMIGLKFLL